MSVPAEGGKPGPVGELRGRSIEELMEILDRQQKLLSNKNFIAKLPDKGKKIFEYTEKVRIAVDEHNNVKKKTDLLLAFRTEFQEKQYNIKDNTQNPAVPLDKVSTEIAFYNKSLSSCASDTETTHLHNIEINSSSIPMIKTQETGRNHSDTAEDTTSALVTSLKCISLTDHSEEINKTSVDQEKNISYPFTTGIKKSHYIDVIERREKNPVRKTEKFRTNRLASNSNSPTPNQSPGEGALKMSLEERRIHDRKHLDDITAARLPPLHHSPALLLPLDESLALQMAQKKSYEDKQAKLAAKKLLERLNLKMGTFNPEGDSYMKYRDQRDDGSYEAEE